MTTTPTAAARVSGTISNQLRIAGWHDAADYVAGEWMQSRILAAIQPDPQPVATRSKLELVATPSSAGTVSVEAAAKVILSQPKAPDSPIAEPFRIACAYLEDHDGGPEMTNEIIETFLRALAGEGER